MVVYKNIIRKGSKTDDGKESFYRFRKGGEFTFHNEKIIKIIIEMFKRRFLKKSSKSLTKINFFIGRNADFTMTFSKHFGIWHLCVILKL